MTSTPIKTKPEPKARTGIILEITGINKRTRKPPMPLKRTSIMSINEESENEYSGSSSSKTKNQEVMMRSVLRLRGGDGNEGDSSEEVEAQTTHKDGGGTDNGSNHAVESMEIVSPTPQSNEAQSYIQSLRRLKTIEVGDIDTDSELSSTDEYGGSTLGHTQRIQRLTTKFDAIILSEAFNKKASRSNVKDLIRIRQEYNKIFEIMIQENSILEGRLLEARAVKEQKAAKKVTINDDIATIEIPRRAQTQSATESDYSVVDRRTGRSANRHKAPARNNTGSRARQTSESTQEEFTESDIKYVNSGYEGTTFDADASNGASGDESGQRSNRWKKVVSRKNRNLKIKQLKEIKPNKQFVLGDNNDVDKARKEIWAEIVGKVSAPKFQQTRLLTRGNEKALSILTADSETYKALKELTEEKRNLRSVQAKKPTITIYDVDRDIQAEEITDLIVKQNADLVEDGKQLDIKPIFKRGPRDGQTVWWVCAVDPQSFDKILKKGRIFIGMFSCRVTEYLICTRLNEEIEKNMAEGQHGFKKGRSTITAMEEVKRWVDTRDEKHVMGIFLDISGAFDNVKWEPLIHDMQELGASIATVNITKSYVRNRTAKIRSGNVVVSNLLTKGCPQGSGYGPTLWNITVNQVTHDTCSF
ncbi:hypothetical protein QTP88_029876 [Uroleucon formosanum]